MLINNGGTFAVGRVAYALIDQWVESYRQELNTVVLDIDDSVDVVHGCQQPSLLDGYYDERDFLPIHIYGPNALAQ